MSSPPPNVPYQAYRSKRHSRNVSNPYLTPNVSPPPASRPPVSPTNGLLQGDPAAPQQDLLDPEKQIIVNGFANRFNGSPIAAPVTQPQYEHLQPISTNVITVPVEPRSPSSGSPSPSPSILGKETPSLRPSAIPTSPARVETPLTNGHGKAASSPEPVAGSSTASSPGPSPKPTTTKRVTTLRHVPVRTNPAQRSLASSPLRPQGTHARTASNVSMSPRHLDSFQSRQVPTSRVSSATSTPLLQPVPNDRTLPSIPTLDVPTRSPSAHSADSPQATSRSFLPSPRSNVTSPVPLPQAAPVPSHTPSITPTSSALSASSSSSSIPTIRQTPVRSSAPYRPGFQPNGVYLNRTDEYLERRKNGRDESRVERTRLERRLEKLINLHFPHPNAVKERSLDPRSSTQNRRQSSFFDLSFNDLRTKSAGDLWKEVVAPQQTPGSKADIRSAEQTITPWQNDAEVSQCPLCSASFHPLTNRKHHCRLCGRIMCSLPVKYPQRPQPCSLLFVADPLTGSVEEVVEGVDYGVRRRTNSTVQGKGKGKQTPGDEDKFLKGVRICRDCRPVLLRRQYIQEIHRTPLFSKLYDAFISLEKEIEDALPQFQELLLNLSNEERPAPEASSARKRLLDAFAQYDALAKRIRQLPCPGGQGGSQDRVQQAIFTRANLFLQKNMFPLQALPTPKKASNKTSTSSTPEPNSHLVDPDSEIAHALQPLLEQEALLESFVEEAKAHRKFEDAKTLKANLAEIRVEIDRIMANAGPAASGGRSKGGTSS